MLTTVGLVLLALGGIALLYRGVAYAEARRTVGEEELMAEALAGHAEFTATTPLLALGAMLAGVVMMLL